MQFSQRISSYWNVYSTASAIPSIPRQSWVIMMATDICSKQLMKYKCFQKLTIFGWSCRSSKNIKWAGERETDSPSIELLFGQTLDYSRGDIPHHLATAEFGLIGCLCIQKSQGNGAHPDGGITPRKHTKGLIHSRTVGKCFWFKGKLSIIYTAYVHIAQHSTGNIIANEYNYQLFIYSASDVVDV